MKTNVVENTNSSPKKVKKLSTLNGYSRKLGTLEILTWIALILI